MYSMVRSLLTAVHTMPLPWHDNLPTYLIHCMESLRLKGYDPTHSADGIYCAGSNPDAFHRCLNTALPEVYSIPSALPENTAQRLGCLAFSSTFPIAKELVKQSPKQNCRCCAPPNGSSKGGSRLSTMREKTTMRATAR